MFLEKQKTLVVSLAGEVFEKLIVQAIHKQNSDVIVVGSLKKALSHIANEHFEALFILMKKYPASDLDKFFSKIHDQIKTMLLFGAGPAMPEKPGPFNFYLPLESLPENIVLDDLFTGLLEITQMVKNQSELSAMLIHDMRSPMQSMLSYIELLQSNVFGELNSGQQQMIRNAMRLMEQSLDMMNELSEVMRFENKSFHIIKVRFNIKELIQDVVRALWIRADKKNIKISILVSNPEKEIYADRSALNRVLTNIIANAIRYTPKNGSIRVECQCQTEHNQQYVLKITDSGPGIPAETAAMIFDKYYRIKAGKSGKGFGMGLYVARLFVEAHGGTIGVYNNREGGATFYIQMPFGNS